ncbi:MAG: cytochrome d ubiquinol oxidase subunit II [Syntrophobacterales bacterium]|nr:cytochrome d ubiquinol oxidase subunit II [Syntrophobacterales bacterium]HNS54178.1 cytochrome d ubiquinol oxidase subunit II [Syntrophales bacterium]
METLQTYLPDYFFLALGLLLFLYMATDGYNLGLGIFSLAARREEERSVMIHSIASTWHASQTWLVILGGLLFGAFPVVYGVAMSALYVPVMIMLAGLAFRGVAIEFYDESPDRARWGLAFGLGSLVATVAQGFTLGGLLSGMPVVNGQFAGGWGDWLNPFSALVASGGAAGFVLLGTTYLAMKADGELRGRALRTAAIAAWAVLAGLAVILLWMSLQHREGRFSLLALRQGHYVYLTVPIFLFEFAMLLRNLRKAEPEKSFQWSVLLFLTLVVGIAAALYPTAVPPGLTIFDAAAPPRSLWFLFAVSAVLLPVMLAYNAWQYLVFRGKAGQGGKPGH